MKQKYKEEELHTKRCNIQNIMKKIKRKTFTYNNMVGKI